MPLEILVPPKLHLPSSTSAVADLRPPLKWAGGKRWLVPHLVPLWRPHSHRRLVEPFCGGLSVSLGLSPTNSLLNDLNPHLINFYRWLQHGLQTTLPMSNNRALFETYRRRFNRLIAQNKSDTAEAATLFYYLNRTGFNGLCRFNQSGFFNVPFGRYERITYTCDFTLYRRSLASWDLRMKISLRCHWIQMTSSMPTRRMTFHSPSIRRNPFAGRIRCAWLNGLPNIPARSFCPIKPPAGLFTFTNL